MFDHLGTFERRYCGKLVEELNRQKKMKLDYVYPVSKLEMTTDGTIQWEATDTFKVGETIFTSWADAEAHADANGGKIEPLGKSGALPLSTTAEVQICERMQIPRRYIQLLREKKMGELAAHNFNELFKTDNRRFLVRTLDGRVRAILSDRYRILDNADLFFKAAEQFGKAGADLWNARLWDDGFQMLGVSSGIHGNVSTDRTFDPGDGWMSRWAGGETDVHNAAVSIENSETGRGGLTIRPAIMRKVCANFNVWGDVKSNIHIGGKLANDGLLKHLGMNEPGDSVVFSDETLAHESRAIWGKIADVIATAFDPKRFQDYIDLLNHATTVEIKAPEVAVANVVKEYDLTEESKALILANLLQSGDRSQYGLCQAVTYEAHRMDRAKKPEQANALEHLGGELIEMSGKAFASLVS